MNHYPEKISKNIKTERLKRGWSQAKLGKYLGVSGKQISNYENEDTNKCTPPIDILLKMCDLFECDLGYLIGEDGYSQKTMKLTIAASETGFTEEALQQIRNVMGISPEGTVFHMESEEYQRILNNFVSSPQFVKLVVELKRLDEIYCEHRYFEKKFEKEMDDVNSKLDKMDPIKAAFIRDNWDSPLDFDDSLTPDNLLIRNSLSDDEKNVISQKRAHVDKEYEHNITFDRNKKSQRYTIQERLCEKISVNSKTVIKTLCCERLENSRSDFFTVYNGY